MDDGEKHNEVVSLEALAVRIQPQEGVRTGARRTGLLEATGIRDLFSDEEDTKGAEAHLTSRADGAHGLRGAGLPGSCLPRVRASGKYGAANMRPDLPSQLGSDNLGSSGEGALSACLNISANMGTSSLLPNSLR